MSAICILAPATQDQFLDYADALCGDETRDRLLPAGVAFEGDRSTGYTAGVSAYGLPSEGREASGEPHSMGWVRFAS
jgi:hypothetical protein